MFLSKRERPPDNSSPSSIKASAIAYRRTSIPSIIPLSHPFVSTSSSSPRRAPLAPLDPQIASNAYLDDQMPPSTTNPVSPLSDRPQHSDLAKDVDVARSFIGRQIIPRAPDEDTDPNQQSLRKRSLSGHANTVRSLPYPPSRSTQRRPSNTPSLSASAAASASINRRPSASSTLHPQPSPSSSSLSPSTATISTTQVPASFPESTFLGGDDLYSGLSSFKFGAAKAIPPSHTPDSFDMISPLTRVPGSGSADRTPRPSISGASSGGRRKSHSSRVDDPTEGDDEYEDEDDNARGKARSKMRAIDDGTRRPSLPTNSLLPDSSPPSLPPTTTATSTSTTDSEMSPGGQSRHSQESDVESSEAEGDDAEAEFDTDVELDLPAGHGDTSLDPPSSDAASQHTFGAGSFDYHGYWQANRGDGELSPQEDDDDVESMSPVFFNREPDDGEGYDDGDRPLPSLQGSRRASVPWEMLGPRAATREREDSAMTVTGRRRSIKDSPASSTQPLTQSTPVSPVGMDIELSDRSTSQGAPSASEAAFEYGPYDVAYILGDLSPRKSWSSNTPSYIQRRNSDDPAGLGASWDADFLRNTRRPSTVTVGSSEDAFTRQLRALDPDYIAREERWSFKKESTDGKGPHRMQLTSATPPTPGPVSFTMLPNTQEMWRQEFVGRYKVDRHRVPSEQRPKDKGPQQRLHIRHIPDPFSKGNIRGGPHSIIHKHSKVVAFSIFRSNSVMAVGRKEARVSFDRSSGILLASKRVQEAYTSTHTTSRLNSHGLLEENDPRGFDGTTLFARTQDTASVHHSRPSTPDTRVASGSGSQATPSTSLTIDRSRDSTSPPPANPKMAVSHASAPSMSTFHSSSDTAQSSSSEAPLPSVAERSDAETSLKSRTSTLFSQQGVSRASSRRSSIDTDDNDSPPRTSHAEAFATVDSSYWEHMRHRQTARHTDEQQTGSKLSALRKFFNTPRNGSSHSNLPPLAQRESNYTPPWLVLAPRSKQEESQRVIQNLNESFQDVGLLPTNTRSSHRNGKNAKGKARQDPRDSQTGSILEKVPRDSLYMLLPLWPGETDAVTEKIREDPSSYQLRIEDRQYLLVYYVPFEDKEKKGERNKKRSRGVKSPTSNAGSVVDLPLFLLRSFRVNARLVSYDDLRGTGVRVPSYGLTITGSMTEAMKHLPSPSIREQRLDEVVICHCTGRHTGMKFDPEGLAKLGLCMPSNRPAPPSVPDEAYVEPEEEAILTPIGRAAVEMAWLGCMAITSFGTT